MGAGQCGYDLVSESAGRGQRCLIPLHLELQVIVSHVVGMPGIKALFCKSSMCC